MRYSLAVFSELFGFWGFSSGFVTMTAFFPITACWEIMWGVGELFLVGQRPAC